MGIILDPESPSCARSPVRPISDEQLCPALKADNSLSAARSMIADDQARVQDGAGCAPSPSSQRAPTTGRVRRPLRYLTEYVQYLKCVAESAVAELMEKPAKRRISCLECPSRLTGLRNLKRHYFELHIVVPRMERPQLKDDAFGLNLSQLRRLSSNDKVDEVLMTKRRRPHTGARKKEAQATSLASARCSIINDTLAVSVAAAVLKEPQPTQSAKAAKPRPTLAQQTAARCPGSASEGLFSSSAADSLRLRPMVFGFDATTIIDLVGRIGRTVANYSGPDN